MPTVQLKDFTIHYKKEGNGHPLIILHGLGNNSQSWKNQLASLNDTFTVIAWDAPGYGESSDPKDEFQHFSQFADVLKEFVDALGYKSVYLLGHSMGSAIAIDFTSRFPEMVDKLIIADPTRGAAALSEEENQKKLQNRLDSINNLDPSELARQRARNLLSSNASTEVIQEAERIMSQVRPPGYRSVSYSLSNLNNLDLLPSISVPTLVICGEEDKVTPVSEAEVFHRLIEGSRLEIIPNAGHLCYQEDPETFNEKVVNFLRE
ncbi:alpha/beta hydrolase [Sporosarcina sp. 179-K 3D1 HS]|uniref:alpha/beta fold hydrolase n=1 Tax=Sporosarcina sp. 179-K 3D1 HS TaxID=3232169 RepID=UPI00399F44A8